MINIALVNRQPRTMGLKELIQHFIEHRKEVITRRTRFLLQKAQQRGHILEGLIFAVVRHRRGRQADPLQQDARRGDREAAQARRSASRRIIPYAPQIPDSALMDAWREQARCCSAQAQAEAIGRLQLIQLVGLEIEKLVNEYREVAEEIEGYERSSPTSSLVLDIIREDTFEMKEKYGDDRRTRDHRRGQRASTWTTLIAQEDVVVTRQPRRLHQAPAGRHLPRAGPRRARDQGDRVAGRRLRRAPVRRQHARLPAVLHQPGPRVRAARVRRAGDVAAPARAGRSRTCWSSRTGEKIANVLAVKDFGKDEQFLMFATHKGVGEEDRASAPTRTSAPNGIIAIGLDEGDALIGVEITSGKDHIMLGTKSGLAIRFEEADVRAMGRPAGGVDRRALQARRRRGRRHDRRPRRRQRLPAGAHRVRERLRQAHAAGRLPRARAAARAA